MISYPVSIISGWLSYDTYLPGVTRYLHATYIGLSLFLRLQQSIKSLLISGGKTMASSSSDSRVATVVGTSSSLLSVLLSVVDVVSAAGVDKMPGIFPANLFLPELMPPGFRRLNSRFDFTRGPLRVT